MINPINNLKRALSIGIIFLFFAADISYAAAVRVPMNITGRPKATLDLERSIEILASWLEICRKDDISGAIRFFPDRAMVILLDGTPQPIIVPDGSIKEAAKLFWGSVLLTRKNPPVTVPVSINREDDIRRVLKEEVGLQRRASVKRRPSVSHDYGSSGTFTQVSRNRLFGLTTIPTEKLSLAQLFGLRRAEESLDVPDLDAGLLNRPGARYYLWTGKELKYFVAKDVKRGDITKTGDPDLEPIVETDYKVRAIKKFVTAAEIKFPFYIFAYIPGVLEEDSDFLNIDGKKTHATRLGNIPVLTLEFLANNPHGVTLAKMMHEKVAFKVKEKGGNGINQHIAGLKAENNLLVLYRKNVLMQKAGVKINSVDRNDKLALVRLNIKIETIEAAIEDVRISIKKVLAQAHGIISYFKRMNAADDYADTGIGASFLTERVCGAAQIVTGL
ncbi:MAG: hypothetical protein Q8O30_09110 [Candidatus Omnitrophota bacterium]|nr:hypothetical protein [Candidatus Omnitrophota bacterium]